MNKLELLGIDQDIYFEKLDNGLDVIIIPKLGVKKKYIIWGIHFGSLDNKFKINGQEHSIPDGIAHYLEHKMFEQENGEDPFEFFSKSNSF